MGAVALGQQLNSRNRSAKAVPPRQFKDTTRTRYNAIRHGILARCAVLPDEDPQQYEDLRTALARDLGVVGMLEEVWLDQLVSCYWRMQRILRAEAEPEAKLELLHRYEVGLRNEMKGLIAEIREAQLIRRRAYPTDADDVARRERRERSAARHETSFWESVQQDMDGPPPPPAPTPPRGAGEGTRGAGEETRGAAVPAAIPPPTLPRGAGEKTRGAGEGTRGAAVPAATLPPEPPAEAPISDAAVRFAIESRENPTLARLADSTTVRAYVGDRLGLMSRNEGV